MNAVHDGVTPVVDRKTDCFEFEKLPVELQFKIMSYLTPCELFQYVAPVCRHWRQLANNPLLSKHATLHFHVISVEGARETLRRYQLFLRSLTVQNLVDHEELSDVLLDCKKLCSLTLYKCSDLNDGFISMLTKHMPLIQDASFEASNLSDPGACEIAGWKDLRALNLSRCPIVWDMTFFILSRSCKKLESINIDGLSAITDSAITVLVNDRQAILKKLFIDGFSMIDDSCCTIGPECNQLDSFGISCANRMSDNILLSIKTLPKLSYLKLNHGLRLTTEGLASLFDDRSWVQLTHLNLSSCPKVNNFIIRKMTITCPNLEKLILNFCKLVTDVGVEAITDNFMFLRTLSLRSLTHITGEPFQRMHAKLLPRLVLLDLTGCTKVTQDSIIHLVKQNHCLTIMDSLGVKLVAGPDIPH